VSDADAKELRSAINRDGLLDLFAGAALVLGAALAVAGWLLMRNPGVFTAIGPILLVLYFEPTRRRLTYPRLGCPGYEPVKEKRFAVVALAVLAVLGAVAFLAASLAGPRALAPMFEHAPAWAGLAGSALLVLLAWWYRSYRLLAYIAVAGAAVAAGYLLGANMLARMALLALAVGLAMTATGTALLARFLRTPPPTDSSR
jgi:hypothetical protein